ncbi:hypothetical protein [Segetibacter koreensis]|uniref:hypothetical protein n=1 Tax=Segetibacter koreensis TaxID=398037 RepID=UPI00036AE1B8|nr:hypothetical protein [Segetibacter koreensis]
MKKLFVVVVAAFIYSNCTKDEAVLQQKQSPALSTFNTGHRVAARDAREEFATLIIDWTKWVYGRNANISPINDKNGNLQYLAQPYSSGIFMLAGSSSQDRVNRTVTIRLSEYQYVFVPLITVAAWYDDCDPSFGPQPGQTPEDFFHGIMKKYFQGPNDLTLTFDGVSLLPKPQEDLRHNSGIFEFHVDPSNNIIEKKPCNTPLSTTYTDGYWAKVQLPPTPGDHILTIGGALTAVGFTNSVEYTIHVKP